MAQDDARDSGVGLAEIVSAYFPVEQLARHLGDNASAPAAPIQLALGQVAAKLKDSGELHPGEQVRLIVVIDQLEELFTDPAITAAERERLVLMLASLARSGVVWVIATMRSDFWHRVAELPLLAELATGEGRLDLWPPNAAELTEIIRQPAAAAGLDFETDEQRMALDAQIASDATSGPGILPLLSYTLEELYKRDVAQAGGRVLRWESYSRSRGFARRDCSPPRRHGRGITPGGRRRPRRGPGAAPAGQSRRERRRPHRRPHCGARRLSPGDAGLAIRRRVSAHAAACCGRR